jgi:hypothetical protein
MTVPIGLGRVRFNPDLGRNGGLKRTRPTDRFHGISLLAVPATVAADGITASVGTLSFDLALGFDIRE